MIEVFLSNPGVEFTLRQLLSMLSLRDSEAKRLLNDINHAAKTIRRRTNNKAYLAMRPPICRDCGYVFKELDSAWRPGKCPRCKSERITQPSFILIRRD
ncbi:transcriptional regulator [Infirmifilum lucidum]|uniref:Transcriptional regulator n=1 Tax=Infirmifilum lucidum TaxID=2776706 RepID=A0A7L9FJN6_9CREN|nr:transcriptional regulator [Infirmifilum lucidum]QOJ79572.1 transcriptional regulator [Infirmifilum lucidum]